MSILKPLIDKIDHDIEAATAENQRRIDGLVAALQGLLAANAEDFYFHNGFYSCCSCAANARDTRSIEHREECPIGISLAALAEFEGKEPKP